MRLIFFICFIILFGLFGSRIKRSPVEAKLNTLMISKDSIDFASQVQPLLIKNCSPCHFTGGKMYARLPFDKDTTIINHEAGILRRIKGDESVLIKTFIQQQRR